MVLKLLKNKGALFFSYCHSQIRHLPNANGIPFFELGSCDIDYLKWTVPRSFHKAGAGSPPNILVYIKHSKKLHFQTFKLKN